MRTALPGDVIQTDDVTEAQATTHHALFQIHVNQLMHTLRLQHDGGWAIVREELKEFMNEEEDQITAKQLKEFFLRKTIPLKYLLRMRMEAYIELHVPTSFFHYYRLGEMRPLANGAIISRVVYLQGRAEHSARLSVRCGAPKYQSGVFRRRGNY